MGYEKAKLSFFKNYKLAAEYWNVFVLGSQN